MLKLCKIVLLYLAFATLLGGFVTLRPYIFGHGRCCPSPRNACINNLKQLEGAKATWALEQRRQTNDVPAWSDIIGQTKYISFKPVCPFGGTYTMGAVGDATRCTVPDHALE